MKKFIYFILSLIVLALIALAVAYMFIDDIAKYAINKYAPQFAKVPVSVESVSLKPFSGNFAVNGLKVGNPTNFSKPNIATIGSVAVDVDMKSLLKDKIIVRSINISKPMITYEMLSLTNNNIASVLKQIGDSSSDSAQKPEQKKESQKVSAKTSSANKNVVINVVNVTNGKIEAAMKVAGETKSTEVVLPDMSIKGIGEKKQRSLKDAAQYIVQSVLQQALQTVMNANMQDLNQIADKNMQGIIDKVKDKMSNMGIFGKK